MNTQSKQSPEHDQVRNRALLPFTEGSRRPCSRRDRSQARQHRGRSASAASTVTSARSSSSPGLINDIDAGGRGPRRLPSHPQRAGPPQHRATLHPAGGSVESALRLLIVRMRAVRPHLGGRAELQFVDGTSGERGRGQSLETRLLFDRELVEASSRGAQPLSRDGEGSAPRASTSSATRARTEPHRSLPVSAAAQAEGEETGGEEEDSCAAFARRKPAECGSEIGISAALRLPSAAERFRGRRGALLYALTRALGDPPPPARQARGSHVLRKARRARGRGPP